MAKNEADEWHSWYTIFKDDSMKNIVKQRGEGIIISLIIFIGVIFVGLNIIAFFLDLRMPPNRLHTLSDKPVSFCLKDLPAGVNITSSTCQQDGSSCVFISSDKSCRVYFSANIDQVPSSWHPVLCQKDAPSNCFEPNNGMTIRQMITQHQQK